MSIHGKSTANRSCVPIILFLMTVLFAGRSDASAPSETVRIVASDQGWGLMAGDSAFYVKGVTWSCTPIGRNHEYQLFDEPEEVIKATIKRDMTLMRAMGVNTIRVQPIPPKWVTYIHDNYGIMTLVNDYLARYGYMSDDETWVFPTDYSDPETREMILEQARETASTYKDVKGVLAYALGNESNYGLEWSSAEVENLPKGQRETAKARYLYSLFEECFQVIKSVDPDHPVGLVNGDTQYMSLMGELCPSADYLGVNVYRGRAFGSLFRDVAYHLNKPVIIMEMGCDAWNTLEAREDGDNQALYLREQWRDLYRNTYGNGGVGGSLGGCVFEWADEWWKRGQDHNLFTQETEGNWRLGAYTYDAAAEGPNMQEEWWGICSISRVKINGLHQIVPRASYYVLREIWKKDPYNMGLSGVGEHFAPIEVDFQFPDDGKAEAETPEAGK